MQLPRESGDPLVQWDSCFRRRVSKYTMDQQYKELQQFGKVKANEPMSKHTTFKIGGPAKYFVIVESVEALKNVLLHCSSQGLSFILLGGGSNMLVSDQGYDGVVIEVKACEKKVEDNVVIADAGCNTVETAQYSMQQGLTDFEWGVGVPGTLGGAVRGNAGAMGWEMKDNVLSVDVFVDGDVATLTNEQCEFGYRDSIFKQSEIIVLRVRLALRIAKDVENEDDGRAHGMKEALQYLQYRNKTQPQGYASTGCIFKNITLDTVHFDAGRFEDTEKAKEFEQKGIMSAGWLIQEAGLKGKTIGGAQISDVHGNFIINLGSAKASDVLSLIELAKQEVYNKYGLALEEEIQLVH